MPETESEDEGPTLRDDLKWGAAVMLVVVLATSVVTSGLWDAAPEGKESITSSGDVIGISDALFGTWLVAFEVLGVLLLAALVGAIVIAVREENL